MTDYAAPDVADNDEYDEFDTSDVASSSASRELLLCNFRFEEIPSRYLTSAAAYNPSLVSHLDLSHNDFVQLQGLSAFVNLFSMDLSNNSLACLPEEMGCLTKLRSLTARNNLIDSLPKSMANLVHLENINLSGNRIDVFPNALLSLVRLRVLHLGGNLLSEIPFALGTLTSLEILYLGGNRLNDVPASIGCLEKLTSLTLCDNILETIPSTLGELKHLETLSLHNNHLRTLPTEIVKLQNLQQLSLRNNPLVHQFVHNMNIEPPTLKELAGRLVRVKLSKLPLREIVPRELLDYLRSASQCVNPKCKGVYFDARVEHVKFVDFCGKYRVPLLQFLCSPKCSTGAASFAFDTSSSESEDDVFQPRMRKVLLG